MKLNSTGPPSPEDFRVFFEAVPVATLVLDRSFTIIAASDRFLSDTMNGREEVIGRHVFEVFPENPDDPDGRGQEAWRASLERVLREEKTHRMAPLRYDIPRPREQGEGFEERWWAPMNIPVFGADGGLCAIMHLVEDITAERRLREEKDAQERKHTLSVETFRNLIRATQDAIWSWDLLKNKIQWNENLFRSFGHDPKAMRTPESWLAAISVGDRERVKRSIMRSIESARMSHWAEEYRFIRGDGTTAWVFDRGLVVRNRNGEPVRMIGSMQDITELVEAEREISRLEEHQKVLAELAEFAISAENLYAVMAEASRRAAEVLDVEYAKVLESLPEEDNLVVRAVAGFSDDLVGTFRVPAGGRSQAGFAFQGGSTIRVDDFLSETRFEIPDIPGYGLRSGLAVVIEGAERPWGVLEADSPEPREFSDDEAAFLETVATILAQAVERDASERQLRYQAALLNAVGESIMAIDLEEKLVYLNQHAELLHGWAAEEIIGQSAFEVIVPEEERERAASAVDEVLGGREWTGEMKLRRKSHPEFIARVSLVPVYDESGFITGLVLASIDLTERIQLEEQLRQAQKMEAVGRLAGGVAHDFNNLLTVVSGHSELLLAELPPGTAAAESVEQISDAADKASSLTAQLLAFSRRQVLQPQVMVLPDTVRRMEKLLRRIIGEDVHLVLNVKETVVPIRADPTQIEQVLLNLAVNARDAMPAGGTLTISVHEKLLDHPLSLGHVDLPPGRYAMLSVDDTGSGIPTDVQPHVFDPFFTTKEQGKGTGLGLATVFGIVQQSGGGVHFDSVPEVGTNISVYFPLVDAPDAPAAREEETAPPDEGTRSLEGRTILVVEDDANVRLLLAKLLPNNGAHVLEAENGVEALRVFQEHEGAVDLVLTDLIMPVMGGAELASRLKRDHPDLPVLFMSGYSSDLVSNRDALKEAVLVRKPFTAKELSHRLREALLAEAKE